MKFELICKDCIYNENNEDKLCKFNGCLIDDSIGDCINYEKETITFSKNKTQSI